MRIYRPRIADILNFKGGGLTFESLSRPLKLYEKDWDRWGWHMSFISGKSTTAGWMICEMQKDGVNFTPLYKYDDRDYRVYRWFDIEPTEGQMSEWIRRNVNVRYDVAQYPWTMVAFLIRHYINRPIPKLLNNMWTCWESVFALGYEFEKEIPSKYDCEMITDFLKAAKNTLIYEHYHE